MSHRFSKRMRLRKRREFVTVQSHGRKFHSRHFLALVAPSDGSAPESTSGASSECGRLGITVSKKVGNAVTRNRIKRLVREYARMYGLAPARHDIVIIAKRSAAGLSGLAEATADLDRIESALRRRYQPC